MGKEFCDEVATKSWLVWAVQWAGELWMVCLFPGEQLTALYAPVWYTLTEAADLAELDVIIQ